jgi:hypothetical protein
MGHYESAEVILPRELRSQAVETICRPSVEGRKKKESAIPDANKNDPEHPLPDLLLNVINWLRLCFIAAALSKGCRLIRDSRRS